MQIRLPDAEYEHFSLGPAFHFVESGLVGTTRFETALTLTLSGCVVGAAGKTLASGRQFRQRLSLFLGSGVPLSR